MWGFLKCSKCIHQASSSLYPSILKHHWSFFCWHWRPKWTYLHIHWIVSTSSLWLSSQRPLIISATLWTCPVSTVWPHSADPWTSHSVCHRSSCWPSLTVESASHGTCPWALQLWGRFPSPRLLLTSRHGPCARQKGRTKYTHAFCQRHKWVLKADYVGGKIPQEVGLWWVVL